MRDALTVALPLIAILAGILLNRQDVKELRSELKELRKEMYQGFERQDAKMQALAERQDAKMQAIFEKHEARTQASFDRLHDDLRQFDRVIGNHEARIDLIEKKS